MKWGGGVIGWQASTSNSTPVNGVTTIKLAVCTRRHPVQLFSKLVIVSV